MGLKEVFFIFSFSLAKNRAAAISSGGNYKAEKNGYGKKSTN